MFRTHYCGELVLLCEGSKHLCCACTVLVDENNNSPVESLRSESFGHEANGLVNDGAGVTNN